MGQYYLTVNVTKRQYLHPHKFGSGLKLMEFSGSGNSLPQALVILMSNGNGQGGGDLGADGENSKNPLIGSWAGDQIVVAGDYGTSWEWVPEDLKGKTYQCGKEIEKFGFRERHGEPGLFYEENLHGAARAFFKDISDDIIRVVAVGDAPYHPWAAMDVSDKGWRHPPENGELPLTEPKEPAGGVDIYNTYVSHAVPVEKSLVQQVQQFARMNPERAAGLYEDLRKMMRKTK